MIKEIDITKKPIGSKDIVLTTNVRYETEDYALLNEIPKYGRGFREKIYRARKKEISSRGQDLPIITYYDKEHDKLFILDGYHRYRVLRDLNQKAYFIITNKVSNLKEAKEYIQRVNTQYKKHNTADIIYRNRENPNYRILSALSVKYKNVFNHRELIEFTLPPDLKAKYRKGGTHIFKDNGYICHDLENVREKILDPIAKLYHTSSTISNNRSFQIAYVRFINSNETIDTVMLLTAIENNIDSKYAIEFRNKKNDRSKEKIKYLYLIYNEEAVKQNKPQLNIPTKYV